MAAPSVRKAVRHTTLFRAILRPVLISLSRFFHRQKISALLIAFVIVFPEGAIARSPVQSRSPLYQALPLERSSQDHILVRAEINGKPAVLLVDTGAPLSAIAIDRREHFGLSSVTASSKVPPRLNINGAFNSMAIARNMRLGALNLVDEALVLIDFAYLRPSSKGKHKAERESDGILGTDILSPLRAILDYDRMLLVMTIDPRVRAPAPGFDFRGYRRVRMRESEGFNLYVDGSINGKPARLMVDTGAFATLLHSPFVRQMNIPLRQTKFRSIGVNVAQNRVRLATISKLSIGSLEMRSSNVAVINLDGLIHDQLLDGKPPVVGLLGSETLHRYHAIIDFGNRSLYLKR